MDGYVKMIKEVMETVLILGALLKEAMAYITEDKSFQRMVRYYW